MGSGQWTHVLEHSEYPVANSLTCGVKEQAWNLVLLAGFPWGQLRLHSHTKGATLPSVGGLLAGVPWSWWANRMTGV